MCHASCQGHVICQGHVTCQGHVEAHVEAPPKKVWGPREGIMHIEPMINEAMVLLGAQMAYNGVTISTTKVFGPRPY